MRESGALQLASPRAASWRCGEYPAAAVPRGATWQLGAAVGESWGFWSISKQREQERRLLAAALPLIAAQRVPGLEELIDFSRPSRPRVQGDGCWAGGLLGAVSRERVLREQELGLGIFNPLGNAP